MSISLDQQSKVLYRLFLFYANLWAIKIKRNQAVDHLLQTSCFKAFFLKKKKSCVKLVSLPHFLHNIGIKIFRLLYSIN